MAFFFYKYLNLRTIGYVFENVEQNKRFALRNASNCVACRVGINYSADQSKDSGNFALTMGEVYDLQEAFKIAKR